MFASGHVSKEISDVATAHDGKAGESGIRERLGAFRREIVTHAKMLATSEDDIARRIVDASDHSVGLAGLDQLTGGGEVGRGQGSDGLGGGGIIRIDGGGDSGVI